MSVVNIHNDYDVKPLFACKGFPSSKHLYLSSIFGFIGLKVEVNTYYKATSLFESWGFNSLVAFQVKGPSRWALEHSAYEFIHAESTGILGL